MPVQLVRAEVQWQSTLVAHRGRFRRYPASAREHHQTGETLLRFGIDGTGH
jgi:hypothetical protein